MNKIDTIANIMTIGVSALLSVVLVKSYLLPAPSPSRPPVVAETAVGTSLKGRVPGVDWSKNGRTLVLAISSECHFCKREHAVLPQAARAGREEPEEW